MKRIFLKILCLTQCLLALSACDSPRNTDAGENAIYYWRTTFSLSDAERDFLTTHNINKLYVHLFDVDLDWSSSGKDIVPQATIQFIDSVPQGLEVVPTIYITNKAMDYMQSNEALYAERIYKRARAICLSQGIDLKELQLDCDWTKQTRKHFFDLCLEIKQLMDSTQTLSSTIRLHQLTQTPPPVDKGVLMVYNTGNLMELATENSIFDCDDIIPYLRDNRLARYDLPLDVAYPVYGWSVVYTPGYKGYHFNRIMQRTDLSGHSQLRKIGDNIYQATDTVDFDPGAETFDKVFKDYRIRVERPSADEIIKIKRIIDNQLKGKQHNTLLYHLDDSQFSHYTQNEIDKIYSRD